jgi:thiamine monophosphate synthase
VCDIVKALRAAGEKIVIVSGRDAVCRTETAEWLRDNGIEYDDLFMRDEGDMRSDDIVKAEILERDILQKYGVKMVIDDRPRVCHMWRAVGIKVIQVGNPYIFF